MRGRDPLRTSLRNGFLRSSAIAEARKGRSPKLRAPAQDRVGMGGLRSVRPVSTLLALLAALLLLLVPSLLLAFLALLLLLATAAGETPYETLGLVCYPSYGRSE